MRSRCSRSGTGPKEAVHGEGAGMACRVGFTPNCAWQGVAADSEKRSGDRSVGAVSGFAWKHFEPVGPTGPTPQRG